MQCALMAKGLRVLASFFWLAMSHFSSLQMVVSKYLTIIVYMHIVTAEFLNHSSGECHECSLKCRQRNTYNSNHGKPRLTSSPMLCPSKSISGESSIVVVAILTCFIFKFSLILIFVIIPFDSILQFVQSLMCLLI